MTCDMMQPTSRTPHHARTPCQRTRPGSLAASALQQQHSIFVVWPLVEGPFRRRWSIQEKFMPHSSQRVDLPCQACTTRLLGSLDSCNSPMGGGPFNRVAHLPIGSASTEKGVSWQEEMLRQDRHMDSSLRAPRHGSPVSSRQRLYRRAGDGSCADGGPVPGGGNPSLWEGLCSQKLHDEDVCQHAGLNERTTWDPSGNRLVIPAPRHAGWRDTAARCRRLGVARPPCEWPWHQSYNKNEQPVALKRSRTQ